MNPPLPYQFSVSQRVRDELRAMMERNPPHAVVILDAATEIERRLKVYPQFGQPLRDLSVPDAQLWVATVGPLVVHYILVEPDDQARRQVMIVRPFIPVTGSGIVCVLVSRGCARRALFCRAQARPP